MNGNGGGQVYVGRKAICEALGVSWPTVKKWIRRRGLPVVQETGFPPSLHREELRRWHRELWQNNQAK